MKICNHEDCNNPVFSKGECKHHNRITYARNYKQKPRKRINQVSKKQKKIETSYKAEKRKKAEDKPLICTACGTGRNLTSSHIVRRSWTSTLTDDPENFNWECVPCHEDTEAYKFYNQNDGLTKLEYLYKNAKPLFWQAIYKHEENAEIWKQSESNEGSGVAEAVREWHGEKEQVQREKDNL